MSTPNLMQAILSACAKALVRHGEPELAELLAWVTACEPTPWEQPKARVEPRLTPPPRPKENTAERNRRLWADPEWRAKQMAAMKRGQAGMTSGQVEERREKNRTAAQERWRRVREQANSKSDPETPKVSEQTESWYEPPEPERPKGVDIGQHWPNQKKAPNGQLTAKLPEYCPTIEQYLGVIQDLLDNLVPSAICTKRGLPTMRIGPIIGSALVHARQIKMRVEEAAKDRYWARLKEALRGGDGGKDARSGQGD